MKKTAKIFLLTVLVLWVTVGVALADGGAMVVTPYTQCATIEELRAAFPALTLADAPQGATEVSYANYATGFPTGFAQIQFTLEGNEYTYRAMAADNREMADDQDDALSGLYIDFDEDVDLEDVREKDNIPFAIPATFTFAFEIEYNRKDAAANMNWYIPEAKTQYNLYSETAGMPEMKLVSVAELLQAPPAP